VEEIFKDDMKPPLSGGSSIFADLPGGVLRLATGKVVRLGRPNQGPADLRVGTGYLLLLRPTHGGADLEVLRGFESVAGQVYGLISNGGTTFESFRGVPENLTEERNFLKAAREAVSGSSCK